MAMMDKVHHPNSIEAQKDAQWVVELAPKNTLRTSDLLQRRTPRKQRLSLNGFKAHDEFSLASSHVTSLPPSFNEVHWFIL